MKDEAVSSVVSAVLVFALFSTAFLLWTVQSLPEWIEDREHAHLLDVGERFADAAIAMANDDEIGNGASVSIPMAPEPVSLVQRAPASASMEASDGAQVWFNITGETLHMEGGQMLGTADAPSGGVGDGGSLTIASNVARLDALLLRLSSDGEGETILSIDDGTDTITLTLSRNDSNAICSGRGVTLTLDTGISSRTVALLCDTDNDVDFTVDALDTLLPFQSSLARLGETYTITLDTNDLDPGAGNNGDLGFIAAVWRDGNGAIGVAGGGNAQDADIDVSSQAIRYRPSFFEFDDRDLLLDAGGVVNLESNGVAFASTPMFRFAGTTAAPTLDWTLFDIAADGSLAGRGSANLIVDVYLRDTRVFTDATNLTIEIQGESAPAWRSFWQVESYLSGFDGIVQVEGQGSSARLVLDPTVPWVVRTVLAEATAEVM